MEPHEPSTSFLPFSRLRVACFMLRQCGSTASGGRNKVGGIRRRDGDTMGFARGDPF
jgi:hypothetical protein